MKCVTTKYGNKLFITVILKGETVDIVYTETWNWKVKEFTLKRFDSTAADFGKKFKKLDKGIIW